MTALDYLEERISNPNIAIPVVNTVAADIRHGIITSISALSQHILSLIDDPYYLFPDEREVLCDLIYNINICKIRYLK